MNKSLLIHSDIESGSSILVIKDYIGNPILTSLSENETTRIFTESSDIENFISELREKEKEKKEIARMLSEIPNL